LVLFHGDLPSTVSTGDKRAGFKKGAKCHILLINGCASVNYRAFSNFTSLNNSERS